MISVYDSNVAIPFSAPVSAPVQVSSTAALVLGWTVTNLASGVTYLQFFNKLAVNVTLGTTAPDFVLAVPGAAHISHDLLKVLQFDTALTVASTTLRAGSVVATQEVMLRHLK